MIVIIHNQNWNISHTLYNKYALHTTIAYTE